MHRPAGEHFRPGRVVVGLLGPADGELPTDTNENDQTRDQATIGCVAHGDGPSSV